MARVLDPRQVTALVDGWMVRRVVPGVQVAVWADGEIVFSHAAGRASVAGGQPVTDSTLYAVASLTKVVTAAVVMRLAERDAIGLDDPVRAYVPAFGGEGTEGVAVRDLLRHTSGLPKVDPDLAGLYAAGAGWDRIVASAAGQVPERPPRTQVAYSNVGYWLLGEVAVQAGGMPFADLARREVFGPLGLEDEAAIGVLERL